MEEIDRVILELQSVCDTVRTEGERVSREIARYVADAVRSGQRSCINNNYCISDTYIIGNYVPVAKFMGWNMST